MVQFDWSLRNLIETSQTVRGDTTYMRAPEAESADSKECFRRMLVVYLLLRSSYILVIMPTGSGT